MDVTILVTRRESGTDIYEQADIVVDEYTLDENPQYWKDEVESVLTDPDGGDTIVAHGFITLSISSRILNQVLDNEVKLSERDTQVVSRVRG